MGSRILSPKRPKRWLCGLTLAAIALQQKVFIVIFGVGERQRFFRHWALFPGLFHTGHYYYTLNQLSQRAAFPTHRGNPDHELDSHDSLSGEE